MDIEMEDNFQKSMKVEDPYNMRHDEGDISAEMQLEDEDEFAEAQLLLANEAKEAELMIENDLKELELELEKNREAMRPALIDAEAFILDREQDEKKLSHYSYEVGDAIKTAILEIKEKETSIAEDITTLVGIRDCLSKLTCHYQKERDSVREVKEEKKRESSALDLKLTKLREEIDAIQRENQQLEKDIDETESITLLKLMKSS